MKSEKFFPIFSFVLFLFEKYNIYRIRVPRYKSRSFIKIWDFRQERSMQEMWFNPVVTGFLSTVQISEGRDFS